MRHDQKKRRPDLDDEHKMELTQEDENKPLEDLATQVFDEEPGSTLRGVSSVIKLIRSRTGGSGVTPLD